MCCWPAAALWPGLQWEDQTDSSITATCKYSNVLQSDDSTREKKLFNY